MLPDELLEEIFLRLPPDRPARLVRASLASKLWLSTLTGARFRGLYRDFHGAPPMLGFIHSCPKELAPQEEAQGDLPHFVATTKFSVRVPAVEDWSGWHKDYAAWDCRHGRVLFSNSGVVPMPLVVWDPMTGSRRLMYAPEEDYDSSGAAVLCSAAGCDHRACHAGPFKVVFVGLYNDEGGCFAYARVSSPDFSKWSESCPPLDIPIMDTFIIDHSPPVFIKDAIYFMLTYDHHEGDGDDINDDNNMAILMYDLGSSCLSLIDAMGLGIYQINLKSLRAKKIWKREQCRALFPYMSFYNPPERASLFDAAR